MSKENIKDWASKGTELSEISWKELPDIDLYMDQVLNILENKLDFFLDHKKQITSTMINNYVKSGVIDRPLKKRYNKEQLSQLMVLSLLKNILPITEVKTLLSDVSDKKDFYEAFQNAHTEAVNEVSSQLLFSIENKEDLKMLALKLSAEANAKRAAAQSILLGLGEGKTK